MTDTGVIEIVEPAVAVVEITAPESVLVEFAGQPGPAGPPGAPGPQGETGLGGGVGLQWRVPSAATTWTITHNLNDYPTVTVLDPNDDEVTADITYADKNTVIVGFAMPFSGTAWLRT